MKLSLSQINSKLSRDNIEKHLKMISSAKEEGSSLVVFPELSLNGYNMMDLVFEDAYEIGELELFKSESRDIDILLGVALREGHKIYNSAVYF
jgi:predicted amidohydrolase